MLGNRKAIIRPPKAKGPRDKYKHKFMPTDARDLGYLCGLIATDGCLYEKEKRITISFKQGDERTLQWLSNLLSDGGIPVYTREVPSRTFKGVPTTTVASFFAITLHELYDYLLDFGLTPHKSLTLDVKLEDKSEAFRLFFLRGVIDGDGSVLPPNAKDREGRIVVNSASEKFMHTLRRFYGGSVSLDKRNQNRDPKANLMYRWTVSGKVCKALIKKLPNRCYSLEKYKPDCHLTTIYHRINKLGLSLKEALTTPRIGTRPPSKKIVAK